MHQENVRFRPFEALTEAEKEQRFRRYHRMNLTAKEVRPVVKGLLGPVLKAHGFRSASPSLSYRAVAPHYFHFLRIQFNSVNPGRFFVTAGIAVDFAASHALIETAPFNPKRFNIDTECLFSSSVSLSNGNTEFDNGTNADEAEETGVLLVESFESFDQNYFSQFLRFPDPLLSLRADKRRNSSAVKEWATGLGGPTPTIQLFIYRLAQIYEHIGDSNAAQDLCRCALDGLELHLLREPFEALLSRLVGSVEQ